HQRVPRWNPGHPPRAAPHPRGVDRPVRAPRPPQPGRRQPGRPGRPPGRLRTPARAGLLKKDAAMTKPAEAMLDPGTLVETLRHTGAGGLADRVESAIRSSPYLAGMVSDAMRMGRLTRITESRAWEPEAQYLRNDGTMSVNFHAHDVYRHPTLSMMVDYRMQKEL